MDEPPQPTRGMRAGRDKPPDSLTDNNASRSDPDVLDDIEPPVPHRQSTLTTRGQPSTHTVVPDAQSLRPADENVDNDEPAVVVRREDSG